MGRGMPKAALGNAGGRSGNKKRLPGPLKEKKIMIINCTPHDVAIYTVSDCILNNGRLYLHEKAEMEYPEPLRVYPAAKKPARVTFVQKPVDVVDGILIYRWFTEEIVNLPEPELDVFCIVSKMVAQACPERQDLIFPGTVVYGTPKGSRWMSADDHVVGCIGFSRV